MKQAFGESHYEVASILESLGALYKNQGKYDQAMKLFKKAH